MGDELQPREGQCPRGQPQPHVRCTRKDAARYAILPGDWARVDRMREFLDDVQDIAFNREMKSIVGSYRGVRVMCVSTGMGGASTGIAVEELHNVGVECMIRIGSCGALQPEVGMGDLVVLSGVVRDDGASRAYVGENYPAVPDTDVLMAEVQTARELGLPFHVGLGRSHDSFYTDREEDIDRYWHDRGVLGADMETSALFTIGRLRRVRCGSILNVVSLYGGDLASEINAYTGAEDKAAQGERNEITLALETVVRLEHYRKAGE
ncbi:nucleoside phosphorylase [Olsenella sp. DNF00959]|uniref:nucleoside phosphorylase n=1 Tax=Olsenella TaxID=133925 RepID=UPI000782153A|nr:nucleoside phosphorylase [Olsenella sp. DNF00959]